MASAREWTTPHIKSSWDAVSTREHNGHVSGEDAMDEWDDATAAVLLAFLRSEGAADRHHAGGRTLLDHLMGSYAIARRWGQPPWLQHAALIHSVYGTESYGERLVSLMRRGEVAAVAGSPAERLAYLFCITPRRPLFAGTHLWARDLPARAAGDGADTRGAEPPSRDELDGLVLLHMANVAEQARASDGSPGRWLARIRALADLLRDDGEVCPPTFTAHLAGFEEADESLVQRAYMRGLREHGEGQENALALAAAACPVVAEPCVWLAHLSRCRDDDDASRAWTELARSRLLELGTAWDKRLVFGEWLAVIDALDGEPDAETVRSPRALANPRALFEAWLPRGAADRVRRDSAMARREPIVGPDGEAGRSRFHRYIEGLADPPATSGAIYPDLPSRPWHDPQDHPLTAYLESRFEQIRAEILALHEAGFHRESERIGRTGDWDVAFLYERGRRHDDVCAACPVTTRAVEMHPAIRTPAGLSYVSRMRPMTHIEAHRGPTNLRVRCHLAIKVPEGDCAIRVGQETRTWEEGKCLVFDDFFVHEAWNHTDEDRIVLIIDLWHPGLSATEVTLLEALQRHTYRQAQRLGRYWAANARSASDAGPSDAGRDSPG